MLACSMEMTDEQLDRFLQALPDEIITVVGSHMQQPDLLAARLVSQRWRDLLRPVSTPLNILPYYLALDGPVPGDAAGAAQASGSGSGPAAAAAAAPRVVGGRVLRTRRQSSYMAPTPAERRQPPACLQPPYDMGRLPRVFPGTKKLAMRMLSRHHSGQSGGVTALPKRVSALFDALALTLAHRGLIPKPTSNSNQPGLPAAQQQPQQPQGGAEPAGAGGATQAATTIPQAALPGLGMVLTGGAAPVDDGLQLSLTMDLDVPRSRYKEEVARVRQLVATTIDGVARLGAGVQSLRIVWYMSRLAHMADLPACFAQLRRLQRLELSMTPGPLLLSLAALTGLTALRIASVGEELHMQDLGVPRHTEVQALAHLTALQELYLDGWVCEQTLLYVLGELPNLKALNLGEDLQAAVQGLPLDVLTRLTAMIFPISLTPTPPGHELQQQQALPLLGSSSAPSEQPQSPSETGRNRTVPQLLLPKLVRLAGPAPIGRLHGLAGSLTPLHVQRNTSNGKSSGNQVDEGSSAAAPAGPVEKSMPPAASLTPASPQAGAARRRQRTPSIIAPNLKSLSVDLASYVVNAPLANGELDVGPLPSLTHLDAHISVLTPEDLAVVQPVMQSLSAGDFPVLKELYLQLVRPQVAPGTMLATPHVASALAQAATSGHLQRLECLCITRQWDGLVPEGWDYTTKGALGYNVPAGYNTKLVPSGLLPRQHLGFLSGLRALTSLHLHTDRIRLSVLPPSLTSLVLEGLLHVDPPHARTDAGVDDAPPGHQCPKLKKLSVMLAKHPRTQPRGTAAAPGPATTATAAPAAVPSRAPSTAGAEADTAANTGHATRTSTAGAASTTTAAATSRAATATPSPAAAPKPPGCGSSNTTNPKPERGQYCVLQDLLPVLPPSLTQLAFSATPSPTTSRLEQLSPPDYGMHLIPQLLPRLASLRLYVMPKHQWLIDCRQLVGLAELQQLRALSLESPLTGATRLACLTALSLLTQLSRLTTGKLDDDAYPGHVTLAGCPPAARRRGLVWLAGLVAGRFGKLPEAPLPAGSVPPSSRSGTPGAAMMEESEGPGALLGSDREVHSEDLLFESDAGEELSSEEIVFEEEQEEG